MEIDLIDLKKSVDELTTKALPEAVQAMNQLVDRLERLFERLDGASLTLTLGKGKQQQP